MRACLMPLVQPMLAFYYEDEPISDGGDESGSGTIVRASPLVGLNLAKRRSDNILEGPGGVLITGDLRGVPRPSGDDDHWQGRQYIIQPEYAA